ncbi:hypothetical protein ABTZ03_13925 [Kitasatospora sp. NPDC096077]|uniref:hypothetical protein n=1 Tax=Kitasatospora sp. NPDC096077 TaxID=3155544 RepID=UPI00332803BD
MKCRALTRVGTLSGAVLLALTAPALAFAATGGPATWATGTFGFTTPGGVQEQIFNPQDDTCYNADVAGPVQNGTNRDARLYPGTGCRGTYTTIIKGQNGSYVDAKSVMFIR